MNITLMFVRDSLTACTQQGYSELDPVVLLHLIYQLTSEIYIHVHIPSLSKLCLAKVINSDLRKTYSCFLELYLALYCWLGTYLLIISDSY